MSMLKLVDRFCLGQNGFTVQVQVLLLIGGHSSIGRISECGTVGSLFKPGCPPLAKIVQFG